jgi:predicted nucleotidyltransferase
VEQASRSDIDLLIDLDNERALDLFDYAAIAEELQT